MSRPSETEAMPTTKDTLQADSARSVGVSIIVMSGRILCSSVCAAPERSTLGGQCRRAWAADRGTVCAAESARMEQ
jgi:hypothetical protein